MIPITCPDGTSKDISFRAHMMLSESFFSNLDKLLNFLKLVKGALTKAKTEATNESFSSFPYPIL